MPPAPIAARIPDLGAGLGYRSAIGEAILAHHEQIDFLEIIADQFVGDDGSLDELRRLCDVFPVIPHGVELSVGSVTGTDPGYLRQIKRVSDITGSPYYSEHLCVTRSPGLEIGHLAPIALTEPVLNATIANVNVVQDTLEKPLVLENVTYLFAIPGGEMTQAEFFGRLVEMTGCGVLLDVTNVAINAVNHGFDAAGFLAAMPLDSVVQVHLAGGRWSQHTLVDTHSEPVSDDSWRLLDDLVARTRVPAAIIEHDANFPPTLEPLLDQVARARSVIRRAT